MGDGRVSVRYRARWATRLTIRLVIVGQRAIRSTNEVSSTASRVRLSTSQCDGDRQRVVLAVACPTGG